MNGSLNRLFKISAAVFPLLIAASLLQSAVAGPLPSFDRIRALETPRTIDDAELIDQTGRPFRLSALRGKVSFVLFGFTNCPDVCPITMERLRELHDSTFLDDVPVAYVMISVDGERDTPALMREFIAKYSTDFIGLTADPDVVKPITKQFSATFFKGSHTGHDMSYNVTHSPQIFVLDQAGQLRAEVYGASLQAMTGIARALLSDAEDESK